MLRSIPAETERLLEAAIFATVADTRAGKARA